MEIVMARGDFETRTFQLLNPDNTPFTETLDNLYFTVKKTRTDRQYKFQKRLSDLGIVPLGDGRYQVNIEPEDTDKMAFGKYIFDIEPVIYGELKKTFAGTFVLTTEVTHAANEVRL